MLNKINSPIDILCRELYRLDNDIDRLQMLITLKSHLHHLQLTPCTLQYFFSLFNNEQYRLQAIHQLIPFIHIFITSDSLPILLDLFTNNEYRLKLIEILKNNELLKTNQEIIEILDNEYFLVKNFKLKQIVDNQETNISPSTTSNMTRVLSNTSGVFEKAKQFVCRVFGSSSSSFDEQLTNKRLINEVNSSIDNIQQKKFHSINNNDLQFQSTPICLSKSYTSIITKSPPPPSPIEQSITRQSSMIFHVDETSLPIQSIMVTQIHSILDNIDSVLDKIEAQTNSIVQRPAFNENYPRIQTTNSVQLDIHISEDLPNTFIQQSTDQITQTALNIVERHLNMNDGSGDTAPAFIDLLDFIEESNSIISSEDNEEIIDNSD
ncbi:unnamed protein product [Adineta steineri]|uniref:Uncharacterized protein n=1 Tax=Adineta steineri TaxID=433720 RepID=A0A813NQW0_9BILA|nr:unnamed protein product [Adineta steineri]CAF3545013.1 unnamed protein product [Adineta steineri]